MSELGNTDVSSEDGYRAFTKGAIDHVRNLAREIEFVSGVVSTLLAETPHNDPKGSSRRDARRVRNYLRRAAQLQNSCAAALAGAWGVTETAFIPDRKGRKPPGMQMRGGTSRRAG